MSDRRDLELILGTDVPLVFVETRDEARLLELLCDVAMSRTAREYLPLFRWSVTDGLQRIDLALEPQRHNAQPGDVLGHIRATENPAIYALLDFHPYLEDPVNVRLLKDIALSARGRGTTIMLISHAIDTPDELRSLSARFALSPPSREERLKIVADVIERYRDDNPSVPLSVDPRARDLLVDNLAGLSHSDTERLARNAIFEDGAISEDDLPAVMKAKYELLNQGGALSFEYETVRLDEIAGFHNVKVWLQQRKSAFGGKRPPGLDLPKGILLLGVQGCGKSLAAKAAASVFEVPLLRLDFGSLYSKYHGETERNLRESLNTAEVMSPCVLWLDEIEKGLAGGADETGTSRRVIGSLLTWMAERDKPVLLVATANDVDALAPELIRKGRFDETFFVDLPSAPVRSEILRIHLRERGLVAETMDLPRLTHATSGFSGAEIEQGIVSALYAAHAYGKKPGPQHILAEFKKTKPLSVVMAEKIDALRTWARGRTVPADIEMPLRHAS